MSRTPQAVAGASSRVRIALARGRLATPSTASFATRDIGIAAIRAYAKAGFQHLREENDHEDGRALSLIVLRRREVAP